MNVNGAGVSTSPTLACHDSGRLGRHRLQRVGGRRPAPSPASGPARHLVLTRRLDQIAWRFRDCSSASPVCFPSAPHEALLTFRFSGCRLSNLLTTIRLVSAVRRVEAEAIIAARFPILSRHCCQIVAVCFPICFSSFPLLLQVRYHRLDELKLRLDPESRKQAKADLSTERLFGGG